MFFPAEQNAKTSKDQPDQLNPSKTSLQTSLEDQLKPANQFRLVSAVVVVEFLLFIYLFIAQHCRVKNIGIYANIWLICINNKIIIFNNNKKYWKTIKILFIQKLQPGLPY